MHLNADELIDLAEGKRPDASAPHLEGCDRCRRQLAELRAMMTTIMDAEAGVPEPSPLFWDHLSNRVRVAVAAEDFEPAWRLDPATWRRLVPLSAGAVAAVLVAVLLSFRLAAPHQPVPAGANASLAREAIGSDPLASGEVLDSAADDPSLTLVASLTEDLDLDAAGEAGLVPGGGAEHAVTHMSDEDLRELKRVLKEELARPGA